jgi:hypothetical protein
MILTVPPVGVENQSATHILSQMAYFLLKQNSSPPCSETVLRKYHRCENLAEYTPTTLRVILVTIISENLLRWKGIDTCASVEVLRCKTLTVND